MGSHTLVWWLTMEAGYPHPSIILLFPLALKLMSKPTPSLRRHSNHVAEDGLLETGFGSSHLEGFAIGKPLPKQLTDALQPKDKKFVFVKTNTVTLNVIFPSPAIFSFKRNQVPKHVGSLIFVFIPSPSRSFVYISGRRVCSI